MTTYSLSPLFNGVQSFTAGGIPLSGGLIYVYLAGTTTPTPTYTDSTGGTPNSNPIVLNAAGFPPNEIWLANGLTYKFVVKDSLGNAIGIPLDNVSPVAYAGANSNISSLTNLTSINGGQLSGFRNAIINANFGINQRAVSGTVTLAAGVYGHDRWKAGAGGCTYTFATSANVTTLTISAGTLQQVIEGANLQTGSYKLSWVGTATARIDSGAYGPAGVVGAATGGTNQTIEFATGTVSQVQYEFGSVSSTFEQRPIGLELVLSESYFNEIDGGGLIGLAQSATTLQFSINYPAMRVAPTVVMNSSTYTVRQGGTAFAGVASVITTSALSTKQATITVNGFTGMTVGYPVMIDSGLLRLFSLSSEL